MKQDSRASSIQKMTIAGAVWLAVLGAAPALAQAPAAGTDPVHERVQEARANPQLEKKLLTAGRKVAAVCANCHGDKGHSSSELIPVLAGQNPDYLIEQARKYVDGRRRNVFMEGVLKALSVDETAGMAMFYAVQPADPQPDQSPALVEKGRQYFVKICIACHGADARGSAHMPRLAGQHPGYVLASLKHFSTKDGVRSSTEMETVVRGMTEADMKAVAAYVASLP